MSTKRLTTAVTALWGKNCPTCHHTAALFHVAREYPLSPAMAAVQTQVDALLANEREWCVLFDNLRSLVATWEREQGVQQPVFWEGAINATGHPKKCRHTAMLEKRKSDASLE